jgi:AcrR family transcriptional regulator
MAGDGGASAVGLPLAGSAEGGGVTELIDWHGSTPERVARIQRARIYAAIAEACVEYGAANVTVTDVVGCAGVSRRTYYELFENYDECLLSTLQDVVARVRSRLTEAVDANARWRERIRTALVVLLGFLEEEPVLGRLLVVEWQATGRRALQYRAEVFDALVRAVDEGRLESGSDPSVSDVTAEGVVGAVLSVLQGRMLRGDTQELMSQLVNPLMRLIVLPYLGPGAARRELDRPLPAPTSHEPAPVGNPLKDVEMRLTYRTVRVLTSIAANPAASNRAIGEASGISDQGQVSKILARLKRLQLVANVGLGPAHGQPNAWMLTGRGREIARTVSSKR